MSKQALTVPAVSKQALALQCQRKLWRSKRLLKIILDIQLMKIRMASELFYQPLPAEAIHPSVEAGKGVVLQVRHIAMLDGVIQQIIQMPVIVWFVAWAVIPIIPPDWKFTVACGPDEMRRAAVQFLDQTRQQMTGAAFCQHMVMIVEDHPMLQFPSMVQTGLPKAAQKLLFQHVILQQAAAMFNRPSDEIRRVVQE